MCWHELLSEIMRLALNGIMIDFMTVSFGETFLMIIESLGAIDLLIILNIYSLYAR